MIDLSGLDDDEEEEETAVAAAVEQRGQREEQVASPPAPAAFAAVPTRRRRGSNGDEASSPSSAQRRPRQKLHVLDAARERAHQRRQQRRRTAEIAVEAAAAAPDDAVTASKTPGLQLPPLHLHHRPANKRQVEVLNVDDDEEQDSTPARFDSRSPDRGGGGVANDRNSGGIAAESPPPKRRRRAPPPAAAGAVAAAGAATENNNSGVVVVQQQRGFKTDPNERHHLLEEEEEEEGEVVVVEYQQKKGSEAERSSTKTPPPPPSTTPQQQQQQPPQSSYWSVLEIVPDVDVGYAKTLYEKHGGSVVAAVSELLDNGEGSYPKSKVGEGTIAGGGSDVPGSGGGAIIRNNGNNNDDGGGNTKWKYDYMLQSSFEPSESYKSDAPVWLLRDFPFLSTQGPSKILKRFGYHYAIVHDKLLSIVKGGLATAPAVAAAAAAGGDDAEQEDPELAQYERYVSLCRSAMPLSKKDTDEVMRLAKSKTTKMLTRKRPQAYPEDNFCCAEISDPVLREEVQYVQQKLDRWVSYMKSKKRRRRKQIQAQKSGTAVECACCYEGYARAHTPVRFVCGIESVLLLFSYASYFYYICSYFCWTRKAPYRRDGFVSRGRPFVLRGLLTVVRRKYGIREQFFRHRRRHEAPGSGIKVLPRRRLYVGISAVQLRKSVSSEADGQVRRTPVFADVGMRRFEGPSVVSEMRFSGRPTGVDECLLLSRRGMPVRILSSLREGVAYPAPVR